MPFELQTIKTSTKDELYEIVQDYLTEDEFEDELEGLFEARYLIKFEFQDEIGYHIADDVTWKKVRELDNSKSQRILRLFIDDPDTFLILINTQKGKTVMVVNEIAKWIQVANKQVVPIIMVDNDQGLADQTVPKLENMGTPVKVHYLSGSAKKSSTIEMIKADIDSYAAFGGSPPLIVLLSNRTQFMKLLQILAHIRNRYQTNPEYNLHYGIIFDEADRVYPQWRDEIKQYTEDGAVAKHSVGFVSATDGDLIDSEDYPECSNANILPESINPEDEIHYRAIHTGGTTTKFIDIRSTERNNAFAIKVVKDNINWFREAIPLKVGVGFRKTIINSNASLEDIKELKTELQRILPCDGLIYNQLGLTVYKYGCQPVIIKTKRRTLSEVLLYAYKLFNLGNLPLFIMGRRKVDRGIGFHYAPRIHHADFTPRDKVLEFIPGRQVHLTGHEELIWTDEILGYIADKDTGSQKAGRLAGIIGQCNSYPIDGPTWWTTKETYDKIVRHNKEVDHINEQCRGLTVRTALQAKTRAKVEVEATLSQNNPKTVPEVFGLTSEEYSSIRKIGNTWITESALSVLEEKDGDLVADIQRMRLASPHAQDNFVQPTSATLYEITITKSVNAKISNTKHWHDGNSREHKNIDKYGIYLDSVEKRIIVMRYYGTRINVNQ
jgi:hypothetical protein